MKLSAFRKDIKLTKQEKAEYALITLAGVIIAAVGMYCFTPAFAKMTESDICTLVETIVKVICYLVGALFAIIGVVKLAISHANEDGPAQQKAIMMLATGGLLIVLGALLVTLIKPEWFKVS